MPSYSRQAVVKTVTMGNKGDKYGHVDGKLWQKSCENVVIKRWQPDNVRPVVEAERCIIVRHVLEVVDGPLDDLEGSIKLSK